MLMIACTGPAPAPEPYVVATASNPADWLAARIAGEPAVRLRSTGEAPSAEVLAAMAEADLVVANGAGYEPWLAALPERRVVDTSDGLDLIDGDPRTWTDPETYLLQGRALYDRLARDNGRDRPIYDEGLAALERDLLALDAAYAEGLAAAAGVPVAASTPSWRYLARRYDLDVTVVAPEEVTAWSERTGGRVLLWPEAPSAEARAALPGVQHVVLDPLDGPGDYLDAARGNVAALAPVFGATATP